MIIYCAHKYGGNEKNKKQAEEKIKSLQLKDLENTYISPIHCLGYLYNETDYNDGLELCLDLLSISDELLVMSEHSKGVDKEIEIAKLLGMPIRYEVNMREDTND